MDRRRQMMRRSADFSKRQPLLKSETPSQEMPRMRRSMGELAGSAAAEFTAVGCCCPCAVVDILVLAMYKVPVCLCRKALGRKRRQRVMKKQCKGLLYQRPNSIYETYDQPFEPVVPISTCRGTVSFDEIKSSKEINEFIEMENEMWPQMYGSGFWRSSFPEN